MHKTFLSPKGFNMDFGWFSPVVLNLLAPLARWLSQCRSVGRIEPSIPGLGPGTQHHSLPPLHVRIGPQRPSTSSSHPSMPGLALGTWHYPPTAEIGCWGPDTIPSHSSTLRLGPGDLVPPPAGLLHWGIWYPAWLLPGPVCWDHMSDSVYRTLMSP